MAAYAAISDLIARHDARLIGELISDTDDPASSAEVAVSTVLTALLTDASGQVESAMLCGDRYRPADLEGLTGNSLGLLKKITCIITMAALFDRRPGTHIEQEKYYNERAQQYLEYLRTGKNLFLLTDDTTNLDAAKPSTEGPSVVEYENLNLLPEQMVRHFPSRQSRLPSGR